MAIRGNVIAFHAADGQLYVFERTASGWQSSPVAEPSYNAFAYATDLEIDNGTIVVAGVVCSEQQVRAYRKNVSGTWARIGTASVAPGDCSRSRFPVGVAISGNTTVVSVDRLSDDTGAAYFYGPPSTWSQPVQALNYPLFDASPVAISGDLSVLSGSELFQRSWADGRSNKTCSAPSSISAQVQSRSAATWFAELGTFRVGVPGGCSRPFLRVRALEPARR